MVAYPAALLAVVLKLIAIVSQLQFVGTAGVFH